MVSTALAAGPFPAATRNRCKFDQDEIAPTSTIRAILPPLSPTYGNCPSKSTRASFGINRRVLLATAATLSVLPALAVFKQAQAQTGPLQSWNDGPAKQAILDFVRATTDPNSPHFVRPEERIATFDQDGTLWVEHPMYSQMIYCIDRVPELAARKPAAQARGAVQDGALRRPTSHGRIHPAGPRKDHRRHAHRHDHGRVRCRSEGVARHRQGSALEAALYGPHLSAHAGGDELPPCQRL